MWIKADDLDKEYDGYTWVSEPNKIGGYHKPYPEYVFWRGGVVCMDVLGDNVMLTKETLLWLIEQPDTPNAETVQMIEGQNK